MLLITRAAHRAVAAVIAATALLLTGCVLLAPQASAHDALLSTTPAPSSAIATAPAQVRLTFDKPALALGTEIRVTDPDGTVVSAGSPKLVDTFVTEELAGPLPAGGYLVTWRVTSADGHPVSGVFGFTAKAAGQGALAQRPAATTAPGPGAGSGGGGTSSSLLGAGVALLVVLVAGVSLVTIVAAGRRRRRDT